MSEPIERERVRSEQREFWNRAAPGWKQLFHVLDRAAQPVSDRLVELARIKPGDRVLDIATGSGEPGITAARKVGSSGSVVATDLSPAMIELARERAAGLAIDNIKFVETDAESLAVGEGIFDAALCRWGLMFPADLAAVTRRISQLVISGAWFATAVWGPAEKVPMISVGEDAIRDLAKLPPPPPDAPHPLRLANTTPLEQALKSAGFKDLHIEPKVVKFEWKSPQDFTEQRRAMSAPFRELLSRQPAELQQKLLDAVTSAAGKYADASGRVRMDNEATLIAAHT